MSSTTTFRLVFQLFLISVCMLVCHGGILGLGQHIREGDGVYVRNGMQQQAMIEFPSLDEMTSEEREANRQRARKVATIIEKSVHMLADDLLQMWAITRAEKKTEGEEVDDEFDTVAEEEMQPEDEGGTTEGTGGVRSGQAAETEEKAAKATEMSDSAEKDAGTEMAGQAGIDSTEKEDAKTTKKKDSEENKDSVSLKTEKVDTSTNDETINEVLTNTPDSLTSEEGVAETDVKEVSETTKKLGAVETKEPVTLERKGEKGTMSTSIDIKPREKLPDENTDRQEINTTNGENIGNKGTKKINVNTLNVIPTNEANLFEIRSNVNRPGTYIKLNDKDTIKV